MRANDLFNFHLHFANLREQMCRHGELTLSFGGGKDNATLCSFQHGLAVRVPRHTVVVAVNCALAQVVLDFECFRTDDDLVAFLVRVKELRRE